MWSKLPLAALPLLAALCLGQPAFEAASVKPASPSAGTAGRIQVSGDRATFTNRTLIQLLTYAYGIGCCDRIKGPSWMASDRFDIVAKAPDGTPKEQFPAMTQTLLRERFKLVLHLETRDLPVYDLVRGKGKLTMQRVDGAAVKNDFALNGDHRAAKSMNMETLSYYVTMMLRTPVLDNTALDGYYDFPLDSTKEETLRDSYPSIFDEVADLGLALESKRAPLDVLIIDQGERVPVAD